MQRTCVLHPTLKGQKPSLRSTQAQLEEAVGLSRAIDVDVVQAAVLSLPRISPGHYVGKGKLEELHAQFAGDDITLVIFNTALSPIQQRNLERALKVKVIDRTALILEIFGERAQTREGVLQVELAHLSYQQSRLVRSWTHLERQRGGFGFMGGPGETQIETDRRLLRDRIKALKLQLEDVRRTRALARRKRVRAPFPVVALVGYTNAGKSTLFNRLTDAEVLSKDMLFATLDPTVRRIETPSGDVLMLTDTVGFISDLPTELIAAFRATLEEVQDADLILHIQDISAPDHEAQREDVLGVLAGLGISKKDEQGPPIFDVFNKVDQVSEDERARLENIVSRQSDALLVSAVTGEGCATLLKDIAARLPNPPREARFKIGYDNGAARAAAHRLGRNVEDADADAQGVTVTGQFDKQAVARVLELGGQQLD